jgi:hypothetical protein
MGDISNHINTMVWMFVVGLIPTIFTNALTFVWNLFMLFASVNEYHSKTDSKGAAMVIDAINKRGLLSAGTNVFFKSKKVATITIGATFLAIAKIERTKHMDHICITVYTLRRTTPLVRDEDITAPVLPGHVTVLMRASSSGYEYFVPMTSAVFVRPVNEDVASVANAIADIVNKSCEDNVGNVFMIAGPPGKGKSLSGRIIAERRKAMLYPSFDPRKSHDCIVNISTNTNEGQILVAMMDEGDVVLSGMDKPTRNNMLDTFNSNPEKIMLVSTTNKPLEEMYREDPSLIRAGRMIKIEVNETNEVRLVDDDELHARVERLNSKDKKTLPKKFMWVF